MRPSPPTVSRFFSWALTRSPSRTRPSSWGGRARLAATFLAYLLSAVVALAILAVPATILRMVEVGAEMNVVAATLIAVGPWVYIALLLYSATDRIHKTVPARVIAYLALGLMPIILLFVLIWRYLDPSLAIGLV